MHFNRIHVKLCQPQIANYYRIKLFEKQGSVTLRLVVGVFEINYLRIKTNIGLYLRIHIITCIYFLNNDTFLSSIFAIKKKNPRENIFSFKQGRDHVTLWPGKRGFTNLCQIQILFRTYNSSIVNIENYFKQCIFAQLNCKSMTTIHVIMFTTDVTSL